MPPSASAPTAERAGRALRGALGWAGLSLTSTSRIVWNAVAPPPGDSVVYAVTVPAGTTTTTAATSYQLPALTLTPGQYAVRTQISSGWRSQAATITVGLNVLGILYTCSAP